MKYFSGGSSLKLSNKYDTELYILYRESKEGFNRLTISFSGKK